MKQRNADRLNAGNLRRGGQGITGIASSAESSLPPAHRDFSPSNLQEAIAPLAAYTARLTIVALVILPPLVFLALEWYFFPPNTAVKGIAWIGSTIGIWVGFLANLAQFTGFSLRDIWNKADLRTRWTKTMAAIAFTLGGILLVAIALIAVRWSNLVEQQSGPIHSNEIVILVAEFSEGASYEIPVDRTITHRILEGLEELKVRDPRIVIRKLGQVILDPDTAVRLGREKGAVAVIWGTYTSSPTSVLVEPHLKLVSPSVAVFAEGHLMEPKERRVDIEEMYSFKLHLELQQEMAFLSSFVASLAHYSEKRFDRALADFDVALELAAESESLGLESVHYYKGLTLRQQDRYAEAEKEFEESVAIKPTLAAGYNALGLTYDYQGQVDLAIEQYLKAIEVDPQFASAYNNLAIAYGVQDKPVEVRIELYSKALEIDPDSSIVHQNLGSLYRSENRYDEALAEYQEAIQANPYDADSYFYLAFLYSDMARWGEAQEACQKALELDPDHAAAHNLLGILYSCVGDSRRAMVEYRRALEINPDYAAAHRNLGLEYEHKGKLEQAQAEYEKAVSLMPENATGQCRLGALYVEVGRVEEGENLIAECERLTAINPEDPVAHNELGMVYFPQEKYPEALLEFQQAVQLDPNNYVYHSNLSCIYEELGQLQKAIEEAEEALRLSPDPFSEHTHLSALLCTAHEYHEAIKYLAWAVLAAPASLKVLLFLSLAVLLSMAYSSYAFKDRKRRENATRKMARLLLRCTLVILLVVRRGFASVDASLQKPRGKPRRSFVTRALTRTSRLTAAFYHSLANISMLEGQEEEALEKLQKALEFAPTYLPAAHELMSIHVSNRNLSAAYRVAHKAIRAEPSDALMHIRLGDIYMAWNMIEEAIREWEEAVKTDVDAVISFRFDNLRFDPIYIPAHFTLGLSFRVKGEIEKALTGFKATISSTYNRILRHAAEQEIEALRAEGKSDE
jgi:tetratricopeptide (TPR) repeat protein